MEFISGLLTEQQIYGAVAFFVGIGLLNWCAKLERQDFERSRDPKAKWKNIDRSVSQASLIKRKSMRGMVMTVAGVGCALYGFITFLIHIQ